MDAFTAAFTTTTSEAPINNESGNQRGGPGGSACVIAHSAPVNEESGNQRGGPGGSACVIA